MERRNRSLKALSELIYIDSLDDDIKAQRLEKWVEIYLKNNSIQDFDLELSQLENLQELFYKNVIFLRNHLNTLKSQQQEQNKIKEFLI